MKKNIAVIYGGFSSEHEISVQSGLYVSSVIDREKYNVYNILISKQNWKCTNKNEKIDKSDFSINNNNNKIKFDVALILIHGTPGENGILQAYLEMYNIPYLGSNVLTSSLTFNKFYCNNYLRNYQIKMAESVLIRKNDKLNTSKIIKKLSLPIFVKPNAGGSSFGITKVKKESELIVAINHALTESDEVIIEQFIKGREITCGLTKINGELKAFPLCEIVSKNEFFDYEAKYNSSLNEEIVPAPIAEAIANNCTHISKKIYQILNCSGIVRIDYIFSDNVFYFLEINTIPGMTSESLVPKMIKYANINITDLYTSLIQNIISN